MISVTVPSGTLSWLASAITGTSPAETDGMESVLGCLYDRLGELRSEMRTISEAHFETMLLLSRETPTHYKWHLLTINSTHVWLHEYKSADVRSRGYAESVHNHRYPMSALLLTGGYRYTKYSVSAVSDNLHADVRMIETRQLSGGGAYSMTPNEFHSVTEIQDGTVTLMIQGNPVRTYSVSVDSNSLKMIRHTPIEHRLANLRSALEATAAARAHHQ
jgi:hypothetical protein